MLATGPRTLTASLAIYNQCALSACKHTVQQACTTLLSAWQVGMCAMHRIRYAMMHQLAGGATPGMVSMRNTKPMQAWPSRLRR